MSRVIFRTSLVHSCYSAELGEPRPKKCKCRKLITKDQAIEWVKQGIAEWVINYEGGVPVPSWAVALRNRGAKTPRAQTIEKAHMQRGLERSDYWAQQLWMADEGQMAKDIEAAALGDEQSSERFEWYNETTMESRYEMFRGMMLPSAEDGTRQNKLQILKKLSDGFGTVVGPTAKYVSDVIVGRANQLKNEVAVSDPFPGRAILAQIGCDQRTVNKYKK